MLPYRVYVANWRVPPVELEAPSLCDAMAYADSLALQRPYEIWHFDRCVSKVAAEPTAAPDLAPSVHAAEERPAAPAMNPISPACLPASPPVHTHECRRVASPHFRRAAKRLHALLRAMPDRIRVYPETWVPLERRGEPRPWVKTFRYVGRCLDDRHHEIRNAPLGGMGVSFCIDLGAHGYLARDDAAKLYELAYFTSGDVLALETSHGLAASIVSAALEERGSGRLHKVDFDPVASIKAQQNILPWAAPDRIAFHVGEAAETLDGFIAEGRKFGFIFVDHYEATRIAASRIPALLAPGGFVQFHDFNDPSPAPPHHPDRVWDAVNETIAGDRAFRFCGVTGASALFQLLP